MKPRQSLSREKLLIGSALILCGLIAGVVWLTPRVVVPSPRLPVGTSNAMSPQQSGVAAIIPIAMSRACAAALRPTVGKTAGTNAKDDVRLLAERRIAVPVAGTAKDKLYDSFDDGRGTGKHQAIDIHAPRGTPVIAAGDGCVVKLFRSIPGGLTVYQFDPEGEFAYYYAHLDRYADDLKEGSQLQRGDVLGYVGTSGNAPANAPHLHFAIFRLGPDKRWWKGAAVNPYAVFTYQEQPATNRE